MVLLFSELVSPTRREYRGLCIGEDGVATLSFDRSISALFLAKSAELLRRIKFKGDFWRSDEADVGSQ